MRWQRDGMRRVWLSSTAFGIAALGSTLRQSFLVEAARDLDEKAGQQVAIGLDVAQLAEHPLDRCVEILAATLGFFALFLRGTLKTFHELAFELAQLVDRLADALVQRPDLLAQPPIQGLVGLGENVLVVAELLRHRLHLFLDRGFDAGEPA